MNLYAYRRAGVQRVCHALVSVVSVGRSFHARFRYGVQIQVLVLAGFRHVETRQILQRLVITSRIELD